MANLGGWIAAGLGAPLVEKVEAASLVLALIALFVVIWDHVRVPYWDRFDPIGVAFEREGIWWSESDPTVRFRFTVRNRVDYRTQVLVGAVETWRPPADTSTDGPVLFEELRDQIDDRLLGSTNGPNQMIAEIDALQRRHLVLVVKVRPGVPGVISPGVTYLVGQRRGPKRRYRGRRRSVAVSWDGQRAVFEEAPRPASLNL